MKENDIRPENLMEEELRLRKEDIKEILKNRSDFVKVTCPACDSKIYKKCFKKFRLSFVQCVECDTIYLNPRPTFNMLANYYANSKAIKYWNDFIYPASEESRRIKIFLPRAQRVIELCKKYNVNNKLLLDVGGGFGTFCEEITKFNFFQKIVVVEPSKGLANSCRNKGIDVIEKPIEDVEIKNADVVTCFELIEHLYNPGEFLIYCYKTLNKNGLLILTTINIKGFDLFLLGKRSDNLGDPNHINNFHLDSIKILLKKVGFNIIEILTPGKLDAELVRNKVLSGEFNISKQPFLKLILIEKWDLINKSFQNFLANNLLSSHMWIVAKKI